MQKKRDLCESLKIIRFDCILVFNLTNEFPDSNMTS